MTHVILWLPTGYPRTLRCNAHPGLSDFALRVLPALLARDIEPKADAICAHYGCGRHKAYSALRNLEQWGYLRRWRRSAGRDVWRHFAVVSDEPLHVHPGALSEREWRATLPAELAGCITHTEDQVMAAASIGVEPYLPAPAIPTPAAPPAPTPAAPATPPAPELSTGPAAPPPPPPTSTDDHDPHVGSPVGATPVITPGIPRKGPTWGKNPPTPDRGQPAPPPPPPHRAPRRTPRPRRSTLASRAEAVIRSMPYPSRPHAADALALLAGLRFAPHQRVAHLNDTAAALAGGHTTGQLLAYLTDQLDSARDPHRVMGWRLQRLSASLATAPA